MSSASIKASIDQYNGLNENIKNVLVHLKKGYSSISLASRYGNSLILNDQNVLLQQITIESENVKELVDALTNKVLPSLSSKITRLNNDYKAALQREEEERQAKIRAAQAAAAAAEAARRAEEEKKKKEQK